MIQYQILNWRKYDVSWKHCLLSAIVGYSLQQLSSEAQVWIKLPLMLDKHVQQCMMKSLQILVETAQKLNEKHSKFLFS